MINANELRIGNWVQHEPYPDEKWKVDMRLLESIDLQLVEVVGIPLTPEILGKCGALPMPNIQFDGIEFTIIVNGSIGISYFRSGLIGVVTIVNKDGEATQKTIEMYGHIKSLHQLQNLYFALTGEDLSINL